MPMRTDNTSGIVGVSYIKEGKKWLAFIEIKQKRERLKYTEDFFEACCARKSAENKYWRTNK